MSKMLRGVKRFAPIPATLRSGGQLRRAWTVSLLFLRGSGWWLSAKQKKCVNAQGDPIPWFTYPSIDYLDQFDYSQFCVLEIGCGQSTLFWAKRAKLVVGIESDRQWAAKLRERLPENASLVEVEVSPAEHVTAINEQGAFDVIVIDGVVSRLACAEAAVSHLSAGGMIVLDNSDQCPRTCEFLRARNFLQVDFTGFAPTNVSTHCTTIFFDRQFNFPLRTGTQPIPSPGQTSPPWPGW